MPDEKLEKNKAIVRRMLDAFNKGQPEVVRELIHPQIRDKSSKLGLDPVTRREPTARRVQTEIRLEKDAFPDQQFKEEFCIAEGDMVVLRWSMTGTHRGKILGRPGTGKKVRTFGTEFVRIQDGKIIEHDDDASHVLDILAQLEILTPELLRTPR
jgi:predicted ester cyclase